MTDIKKQKKAKTKKKKERKEKKERNVLFLLLGRSAL